jgi:hypothetical protein
MRFWFRVSINETSDLIGCWFGSGQSGCEIGVYLTSLQAAYSTAEVMVAAKAFDIIV